MVLFVRSLFEVELYLLFIITNGSKYSSNFDRVRRTRADIAERASPLLRTSDAAG
jgi:hypothetical protein